MKAFKIASFSLIFFTVCYNIAQAQALSISPPLQMVRVNKPVSITLDFQLINHSSATITVVPSLIEFNKQQKDGTLQYQAKPDFHYHTLFSASQFQVNNEPVETITLLPYQHQNVSLYIKDMLDQSTDYSFAGLFSESLDPTDLSPTNTYSKVQTAVASPVLISAQHIQPNQLSFSAINSQLFYLTGPFHMSATLKNGGSTFQQIGGSITLSTIFGQVVETVPVRNVLILSHSERNLESFNGNDIITGKSTFLLGIYKLTIRLNGDSSLSKTLYIFAIPLEYVVVLIVFSFLTTGLYLKVSKNIQQRKK